MQETEWREPFERINWILLPKNTFKMLENKKVYLRCALSFQVYHGLPFTSKTVFSEVEKQQY